MVRITEASEDQGEISASENASDNEREMHLSEFLFLNGIRFWNQFKSVSNRVLIETGTHEKLENMARLTAKHPYLALGSVLALTAVLLPFLIVLVFGVSTIVMTFTGFILLEGTLITIASVLLFGCLGALLIVFIFFGGLTLAGYFGFMHIYDLFHSGNDADGRRKAFGDFLSKQGERFQTPRSS